MWRYGDAVTLDELALKYGTDKSSQYHNYTAVYPTYLEPLADKPVRLLELGTFEGASLRMWSEYFTHPDAVVVGLDCHPEYLQGELPPNARLVAASQTDASSGEELGPFDVIIDDASHRSATTIESFKAWWPHLKPGGLYIVEDTHTSYHTDWGGDEDPAGDTATTMQFLKRLADEANRTTMGFTRFDHRHWLSYAVEALHFHPDLCVIKKKDAELNRLFVAFPLYKQAPAAWFINWLRMNRAQVTGHVATDGVYITRAMNILVDLALSSEDWDRLVIFEHDMIPPLNALERIAAYGPEFDIVGTTYFQHEPPHHVMAWMEVQPPLLSPLTGEVVKLMVESPGLYKVDAVGFGLTAISRRVLENWDPSIPMFDCTEGPILGHDLWFCEQARKQGFTVWLDSGIGSGHLTELPVGYAESKTALAQWPEHEMIIR